MNTGRLPTTRLGAMALMAAVPLLALAQSGGVDPEKPVWAYAITPEMPIADVRGPQPRPARAAGAGPAAGRANGPQGARRGGGPPDLTLYTVPGSKFQFTMAQIRSTTDAVDWFPEEHPQPFPDVVTRGTPPVVKPCYSCHTLEGKGKPENAPIAGLPADYIVRQLREFKSGVRDTADPQKPKDMRGITQGMTEDDMNISAAFYSSIAVAAPIRVVEADTIPHVRLAGQAFHLLDDGTTEPIGMRVVEAAEDEKLEQLRSPHVEFVAYVPMGAIKKGEALVTTGGGKTVPCITCHGQDLHGIGTIPPIAGRSPSYLGRQLYDFKQGTRNGELAPLMKAVADKLSGEDIVDILAYVSSRKP